MTHEEVKQLRRAWYAPSESYEYIDNNGQFYNAFGDELRDPDEYDDDDWMEGYTPFGDE